MLSRFNVSLALMVLAGSAADPVFSQVPLPSGSFANVQDSVKTLLIWTEIGPIEGPRNPIAGRVVLNLGRFNVRAAGGGLYSPDFTDAAFAGVGFGIDRYSGSIRIPTQTYDVALWRTWRDELTSWSINQWDALFGWGLSWYAGGGGIVVEPWLKPRVHARVRKMGATTPETAWNLGLGGALGLTVTMFWGLGAHVAGDVLYIGDGFEHDWDLEGAFSAGLHWRILLNPDKKP